MQNKSPLNITADLDDGEWVFFKHDGEEISEEELEDLLDKTVKLWYDDACGSPDGWCYTTYRLVNRHTPRIVEADGGAIGPGSYQPQNIPTAEEIRRKAEKDWDNIFVEE